jgi:hypothetical protein
MTREISNICSSTEEARRMHGGKLVMVARHPFAEVGIRMPIKCQLLLL